MAVASLNTVKTELITKAEQLAEQGQTTVKTAKKKIKKVVETVDDYKIWEWIKKGFKAIGRFFKTKTAFFYWAL